MTLKVFEHGTNPNSHAWSVPASEQGTIPKSLNRYLKIFLLSCKAEACSADTVSWYESKLSLAIRYFEENGISDISLIDPEQIRYYILSKLTTCKATTAFNHYRALRRWFNWMVGEKILAETPMSHIKPPKLPKLRKPVYTREQIIAQLDLCSHWQRTFTGTRNRAIILVLYDTGMRLSEMIKTKIEDVDFDNEYIKVFGKGAKERLVGISKNTQKAILKYLLRRNDKYPNLWVTEERRPLQTHGIQMVLRRIGRHSYLPA
jgi:integrase/recombinase XerC